MNSDLAKILGIVGAVVVAAGLIYLYHKGNITKNTLEHLRGVVESLPAPAPGSVSEALMRYAKMAVLAVEQLAKTGVIDDTPENKKAKSLEYVQTFAASDGITLSLKDVQSADLMVEANVAELPKSHE